MSAVQAYNRRAFADQDKRWYRFWSWLDAGVVVGGAGLLTVHWVLLVLATLGLGQMEMTSSAFLLLAIEVMSSSWLLWLPGVLLAYLYARMQRADGVLVLIGLRRTSRLQDLAFGSELVRILASNADLDSVQAWLVAAGVPPAA